MNKKFNMKKKTAIYIGRFQPFHKGHEELLKKAIKRYGQVAILVMDSEGINKKNPFSFSYVKKKILDKIFIYKDVVKIVKIPVVGSVIYGRKVGYKIQRIKLKKKLEKISATNIRKTLKLKK